MKAKGSKRRRRKYRGDRQRRTTVREAGSCSKTGKLSYASKAKARKALKQRLANWGPVNVYECEACGGWHVTRQRRRRRQ